MLRKVAGPSKPRLKHTRMRYLIWHSESRRARRQLGRAKRRAEMLGEARQGVALGG